MYTSIPIDDAALRTFNNVPLFKRYVDDYFALVHNQQDVSILLNILNSQNSSIKFEQPDNTNSVSVLDFKITITVDSRGHRENIKIELRLLYTAMLNSFNQIEASILEISKDNTDIF